jgi:tetratricopeptide (TPR) repeat protein
MSAGRLEEALQHIKSGDYGVALSNCREVIERHPDDADAVHLAGYLHQLKGEHEDAMRYFALAAQLAPNNAEIFNNYAGSLKALGRLEESERYYRRAIELDPGFMLAHHNFADLLLALERPAEATARCRAALALEPGLAPTYSTLGLALEHQGRYDEAIAAHRESAARGGNRAAADFGEALVRLLMGEFQAGWEKYEARLEAPSVRSLHERFDYPRWRGASLARGTLLVAREQGLGDEIMFASCFNEVIDVAGGCFITCDRRLQPLFARSFPQATVLSGSEAELRERLAGETVDFQLPAGSLPLVFRTRLEDFPGHSGYLRADPARVEHWRARLASLGGGRWIGLSWRGGLPKTGRTRRSIPIAELRALLEVPHTRFVSLQYGEVAGELAALERNHGIRVEHWPEVIASSDDTAALICALDLTVSVCTAVVHLAGALGRPAWVMVPAVPEWRYGARGEGMPWYPSVRLFRQPVPGDWQPVLERVRAGLAALA